MWPKYISVIFFILTSWLALFCQNINAEVRPGNSDVSYEKCLNLAEQRKYRDALKQCQKSIVSNSDNSIYLQEAGHIAERLGDNILALEYFQKALYIDLNKFDINDSQVSKHYNNLGRLWRLLGDYRKSIQYYRHAISSNLTKREDQTNVVKYIRIIADNFMMIKENELALELYKVILEVDMQNLEDTSPKIAEDYHYVGQALFRLSEYDQALSFFMKSQEIFNTKSDVFELELAGNYVHIADVMKEKSQYSEAIENYKLALEIYRKKFDNNHHEICALYNKLGDSYALLNKNDIAVDFYEASLQSSKSREVVLDSYPHEVRLKIAKNKTRIRLQSCLYDLILNDAMEAISEEEKDHVKKKMEACQISFQ